MSERSRNRLLRELRQSPGKAAVLLLGAIGAAVVWGPRLAAGFSGRPAGATKVETTPVEPAGDSGLARRDPSSIRAEFIKISEDAKRLRLLAEPAAAAEILVDPFAAKSFLRAPAPPPKEEDPKAREAKAEQDGERKAADDLHLTGVIEFRSGRCAVLSGEVLRVGELVSGLLVESIESRAVVLRGRFGSYRLEMEQLEENR